MIWFVIKDYRNNKLSIYLHYMARNNKLKMSKHKGKGITAIGKKSIFKDQFVWMALLSVLEYTEAI